MSDLIVGGECSVPEDGVEVHPDDVAAWSLEDGPFATITSRRGEVLVIVFCSFSFRNVPIHALTGSGYDPITDTAELKVCAVRFEAAVTAL